jgi:hypothetical protein
MNVTENVTHTRNRYLTVIKHFHIYTMEGMLGDREYQFLKDLENDDISKYSSTYLRVLKHRILKKQHEVIECALLINKLRERLERL